MALQQDPRSLLASLLPLFLIMHLQRRYPGQRCDGCRCKTERWNPNVWFGVEMLSQISVGMRIPVACGLCKSPNFDLQACAWSTWLMRIFQAALDHMCYIILALGWIKPYLKNCSGWDPDGASCWKDAPIVVSEASENMVHGRLGSSWASSVVWTSPFLQLSNAFWHAGVQSTSVLFLILGPLRHSFKGACRFAALGTIFCKNWSSQEKLWSPLIVVGGWQERIALTFLSIGLVPFSEIENPRNLTSQIFTLQDWWLTP